MMGDSFFLCLFLGKKVSHGFARSGLCLLESVGIDIERSCHLGVTQGGGYCFDIHAAVNQQGGIQVPECVDT